MEGSRHDRSRIIKCWTFNILVAALGALTCIIAATAYADLLVTSIDGVLRYDEKTGAFIDAFVPRGSGGLDIPLGVVFGPDSNLYVASAGTDSVLRYDGKTGAFIDAFVSRGSGGLDLPRGVVFGPDGNLYVSSFHRQCVALRRKDRSIHRCLCPSWERGA